MLLPALDSSDNRPVFFVGKELDSGAYSAMKLSTTRAWIGPSGRFKFCGCSGKHEGLCPRRRLQACRPAPYIGSCQSRDSGLLTCGDGGKYYLDVTFSTAQVAPSHWTYVA